MSGRSPLPRTRFARVGCSDPGVAVIRISGSLGPRAKPQLVRLTQECLRRNLPRLVLDLSEVDALGGGTARLLNEFAAERAGRGGKTAFRIASPTVRGFLCADPNQPPPPLVASLEEAVAVVRGRKVEPPAEPGPSRGAGRAGLPDESHSSPRTASGWQGSGGTPFVSDSLFAPEDVPRRTPLRSDLPPRTDILPGEEILARPPRAPKRADTEARSLPDAESVMFSADDFLVADEDVMDLDLEEILDEEEPELPSRVPPQRELRRSSGPADTASRASASPGSRPHSVSAPLFGSTGVPAAGRAESVAQKNDRTTPPSIPAPRRLRPEELRDRLVAALNETGVASRVFVFQRHEEGRYYLVTRQGVDRERGFDVGGALAACTGALRGPGFLVDLDVEALSHHEVEILAELNCEVAMPLGRGEPPEYLVFVSKEQPSDEYTLDELQEMESVLQGAQERLLRASEPQVLRAEAEIELAAFSPQVPPAAIEAPTGAAEPARRAPGRPKPAMPPALPNADARVSILLPNGDVRVSTSVPKPDTRSTTSTPNGNTLGSTPVPNGGSRSSRPLVGVSDPGLAPPAPGWPSGHSGEFTIAEPERPVPIQLERSISERPATSADASRGLRRSLAQMRDILSLTQDFDAAFGTQKLLEVLVLSVVSVARVETVLFFAAREGDYRLTHQRGMAPDAVQGLRLRVDATLVQRGLATMRGMCIAADPQITEEERIWARQHGIHYAAPFRYKDETLGLLLLGESTDGGAPDFDMLGSLLQQAGLAYDRARIYETLHDRTLGVVRGLITLIESRNGFDCGSTEMVVRYTQALARELQFPVDAVRDLVYGAVLRDVGMLQVSEVLLRSPADLTGDQWESIRRHPQEGASIMRQMRFSPIAVDVVLHHHEAYNGEGYPMGLRGRSIPLGARIVAVAESYVKMTMDRPYRKALGRAEALESLAENWGLRYDPLVVDALVRVVNRELSMGLKSDRDLTRDLFGV